MFTNYPKEYSAISEIYLNKRLFITCV